MVVEMGYVLGQGVFEVLVVEDQHPVCVLPSCDGLAGESPAGVVAKQPRSWWPAGGEI
ncbi:MAG: hypothetical protein ACRDRL_09210 [Sciscionella sp.]